MQQVLHAYTLDAAHANGSLGMATMLLVMPWPKPNLAEAARRKLSSNVLAEAASEFESRAVADPMPALLPADFVPPIELPWPDYRLDRASGQRWW